MRVVLKIELNSLIWVIVINMIVFFLSILLGSLFGSNNLIAFTFLGGLNPESVLQGGFYQVITSAFFHIDFLHFFVNMYSLYKIGEIVIYLYGGRKFFITYVIGAVGGSALSVLASLIPSQNFISLGASGAIFALLGLLIGGSIKKTRFGSNFPFALQDILLVALFPLILGFLPGMHINNWAHIGGLITGIFLGLIFNHSILNSVRKWEDSVEKYLYWICFAGVFLCYLTLAVNIVSLISIL